MNNMNALISDITNLIDKNTGIVDPMETFSVLLYSAAVGAVNLEMDENKMLIMSSAAYQKATLAMERYRSELCKNQS